MGYKEDILFLSETIFIKSLIFQTYKNKGLKTMYVYFLLFFELRLLKDMLKIFRRKKHFKYFIDDYIYRSCFSKTFIKSLCNPENYYYGINIFHFIFKISFNAACHFLSVPITYILGINLQ